MIVKDGEGNFAHIKCDVETCKVISPPAPHPGLIQLGWHCKGGEHRCPEHKDHELGPVPFIGFNYPAKP